MKIYNFHGLDKNYAGTAGHTVVYEESVTPLTQAEKSQLDKEFTGRAGAVKASGDNKAMEKIHQTWFSLGKDRTMTPEQQRWTGK